MDLLTDGKITQELW